MKRLILSITLFTELGSSTCTLFASASSFPSPAVTSRSLFSEVVYTSTDPLLVLYRAHAIKGHKWKEGIIKKCHYPLHPSVWPTLQTSSVLTKWRRTRRRSQNRRRLQRRIPMLVCPDTFVILLTRTIHHRPNYFRRRRVRVGGVFEL